MRALHAEKDFLDRFNSATKLYGFFGVIIPILVFILDAILCGVIPDVIPGIVMELIGAWVLARAVFIGPNQIRDMATAGYGGPIPSLRKALASDAADGIWGVSLSTSQSVLSSLPLKPELPTNLGWTGAPMIHPSRGRQSSVAVG
ncbi:hypothetical protein, partial [Saliphagus sp. LR7]|uniref:hypothetical protein n=1 Tax=Saliphagus sp. LR7 TaxID=2282654 RepID=UPI001E3FAACF